MWICTIIVLALSAADAPGEFLANPGFEQLKQNQPLHWACFLQSQEGAVARVSPVAHAGLRSVMLHVPVPYERDPLNNWSQNILCAQAGASVHAQVYIRTEAATEAALWVQCWRKATGTILQTADSSAARPIAGTQDWTLAEVDFSVPEGTDFLTLRCVLKGPGTAWFDDAALEIAAPEQALEGEHGQARPEPPTEIPAPSVQEDIERLKRANLVLADTVERLQGDVAALRAEVERLRMQMETPRSPVPAPLVPSSP